MLDAENVYTVIVSIVKIKNEINELHSLNCF